MESRIKVDIGNAYKSKGDKGWEKAAYGLIRDNYNEKKADAWYAEYKSGNQTMAIEQFDKFRKIPKRVSENTYNDARRGQPERRYPKQKSNNHRWLGIALPESIATLAAKRKKTMGLAKSGWFACFKKLGGRGMKAGKAGWGEQATFPNELKSPYNKFGKESLGSVTVTITPKGYRATLTNKVKYADDAFTPGLRSKVSDLTKKYMKMIFDLRKKNMGKRNVVMDMAA
jgi:hypothetical protein